MSESANRQIGKSANRQDGARVLPDGWELAPVRDVFEIRYGKGLVQSNRDESGEFPVYGSSGVVGHHSQGLIDGPCIVVGRKGAVGQVHYSPIPCWPIDTTYYIQPPGGFSLEYVYYALDFMNLAALDKSTAIPGLNRDDFYAQVVPIPPSSEQRRIVAEIETQFTRLDAGVAALERARANLRRYRAAVLKAACEGRLVPMEADLARAEGREYEPADQLLARILAGRRAKWETEHPGKKYKEPEPVDAEASSELPEGWVWTNIGSLFAVTIGGTPSRKVPEYWNGDVHWVSSGEVAFCRIKDTREKITPLGLSNSNAKLNPPGTVLLAMIGEGKTRGQAAILDISAANNQNAASILCSETPILPEWVFYWFMARYEQTRTGGVASGGMQPALNSRKVRALPIAVPPIPEQRRIVAEVERRLSVVEALERAVEAALARARRLRQAVLKQAFEGRLVAQDPDDEPAAVLLERIRATREARATGGRKRKTRQMRLPEM